jgi:hypothetical protein
MKAIIDYIEKNTWFQLDGSPEDFDDEDMLIFSTREHGNIGYETYGQEDWDEGKALLPKLIGEFGHLIRGQELTTCDEWVNIEIELI